MSIWDARERSHGVLKSLKSSPVGAAPWPNSEWRVVDARRTTLSKTRRSLVFIQDASKKSHGVLKSTKSSPVGAAPWQN